MNQPEDPSERRRLEELRAVVSRFEERVRAAQLRSPPTRDLVKGAVGPGGSTRCPVWLRRVTLDVIVRHGEALVDLFEEFPDHLGRVAPYDFMIGYHPPGEESIDPVAAFLADSSWVDEWGVRWRHSKDGVGATEVENPLRDWKDLDDYLARRFPDPRAPGRFDAARGPAAAFRKAGTYSFGLLGCVFYSLFSIRGFENALMDFHENPEPLKRLVAALESLGLEMVRSWSEVGVDAVMILDDWGTQRSMLVSPAIWRKFFKSGYAALIGEAHARGMAAFLHSCGHVTEIIEDLIEVGLDVIDPVQTTAMDIDELARRFGGRISFCGSIDVQQLLPHGSPGEIKDAVRRSRHTLGTPFKDRLILAPTNVITPEVPIENLRAMFEACHEG